MATEPDTIDVPHLVRIGLIGTIATIAVSYYVVGLTYSEQAALQKERSPETVPAQVVEGEDEAILEGARESVLDKYNR